MIGALSHPPQGMANRGSEIENSAELAGSVANAVRLLLMFIDRSSVRVAEASEELGVARSTAHRLISTLAQFGLLEQDSATRAYFPGPRLADLGIAALRREDTMSAILHPILRELSETVQETAHLITLEGPNCRFLDSVESNAPLRTTGRKGYVYPAHTNSGGKAMLAQLSDVELRELFPTPTLPTFNERTSTSRAKLFEELSHVRAQGYATNFGESDLGIAAVAVAVRVANGAPPLAMAVSAPESRLPEERLPEVVRVLNSFADRARNLLP